MPIPRKKPSIVFASIAEISAHQFGGNHHVDSDAFNAIEIFVRDPANSVADRAEALRQMSDRGMGCGRDEHLNDDQMIASLDD